MRMHDPSLGDPVIEQPEPVALGREAFLARAEIQETWG